MKGSASAPFSPSIIYSDSRLALRSDSCTASTTKAIITSGSGQSHQADVVVVKRRSARGSAGLAFWEWNLRRLCRHGRSPLYAT
jgi:hypothetical protein